MLATEPRLSGLTKRPRRKPRMGRKKAPISRRSYSGRVTARVRQLAEEKKISVPKLAELAGVKVNTLYVWLQGRRDIPVDKYPALGKALGVDSSEFLPHF